jgi:hypothetical protein
LTAVSMARRRERRRERRTEMEKVRTICAQN